MRPPAPAIWTAAASLALGAAALAGALLGWPERRVLALVGAAVVVLGTAVAMWAKAIDHEETLEEKREQKGPDRRRRLVLLGLGAGAAVATAGVLSVPAARRVETATNRLRSTRWSAGSRAVDSSGVLVVADQVNEGEVLTIYPEGAVDQVDSQAVLIREPPERFTVDVERRDWVVDGIVVYSKLCTHMACPLGLYQQQTGTLLCPCHQAVFDVLDSGRAIHGPARRALPQLPIEIDADGHIVAVGDFSDAVGTGFWGRP
jgi:ubiquinol-cytochrome c reductase iron-sulfur subunit